MEKTKLNRIKRELICEVILSIDSRELCELFLDDLLTPEEFDLLGNRLLAAKLLLLGMTYKDITAETGLSSRTLSRINRCVNNSEGYRRVLKKIMNKEREEKKD